MKYWYRVIILTWFCVAVTKSQSPSSCVTPNDEKASCVLLPECPLLLKAFASKDPEVAKFVQASSCGLLMVCCGTSTTFSKKPELPGENKQNETLSKEARRAYVIEKLLPNRRFCGLQHTDDYFYNKLDTSVDEFPWLVYLLNRDDKTGYHFSTDNSCVGVLINPRYVLTSFECGLRGYTNSVTIGQHRIYEDVSCIETSFGEEDCTDPSLNEIVVGGSESLELNMVLLRLQRRVSYSDFVRPICLPLDESETPRTGEMLMTSGWGAEENTDGTSVKVKKRVTHTLMNEHECQNANPVPNPICGLIGKNNTNQVCPGDNGGPLMYRYRTGLKNWVTLGIVTGRTSCAEYQPVVATKITPEIMDWIIDNIED